MHQHRIEVETLRGCLENAGNGHIVAGAIAILLLLASLHYLKSVGLISRFPTRLREIVHSGSDRPRVTRRRCSERSCLEAALMRRISAALQTRPARGSFTFPVGTHAERQIIPHALLSVRQIIVIANPPSDIDAYRNPRLSMGDEIEEYARSFASAARLRATITALR